MRLTPFDLVFRPASQGVFPGIRLALKEAGHDPRDRDQFLMQREVVALLHELRPEHGLGEGIDQLAALLHHAYLYWEAGEITIAVRSSALPDLLRSRAGSAIEPPAAYYAAMPEHRVWAEVIPSHPPEPLDGCFVDMGSSGDEIRVLGVFGLQPERQGFSVVEAMGPRPTLLVRADGSQLFSPTLSGGKAAGLFSIVGEEELLDLGWSTRPLAARAAARV
jgi:hypothetical protein